MPPATADKRDFHRLAGRVGGYARAALHDGAEMTEKARETFRASFEEGHGCKVCPRIDLPAGLLPVERARRAEALRRGHYARVAMASARALSLKKAATVHKSVTAQEDRDATTTPYRRAS